MKTVKTYQSLRVDCQTTQNRRSGSYVRIVSMRRTLLGLLLVALVACGGSPAPTPTQAPPTPELPALSTIQTLLQNPAQWSGRLVTLIAAIDETQPRLLVQGIDRSGKVIADE